MTHLKAAVYKKQINIITPISLLHAIHWNNGCKALDAKQELVWRAITIAINMTIDILEIKEYIEELEK